ncbi:acetyl-CoA carboxylase biotin carboxylase subunit family protein [Streptomyces sp. NPDC052396]|uniref:acetyl-CoA carboxylase biotin carboxylase subunit family protein n=1 Tax=Streptomyces sp. NPDC052396 TaxID=3365689 RepID=UPI0037CFAEC6
MTSPGHFVQVGATRDGLDPYLDSARRREMPAVLVETPAYLRWRRALGRRPFDIELGVDQPQDPEAVRAALDAAGVTPALVLTGFERYVQAGFALARMLRVAPWPAVGEDFRPLDKRQQRDALLRASAPVGQPRFAVLGTGGEPEGAELGYPQVVKPVDGGGGLGVLLVDGAEQRHRALERIRSTANYGGGAFAGVVAEEFVKGPEVSLQGIAHAGRPVLLSVCEKLTTLEEVPGEPGLAGFREVGHVARHGGTAEPGLETLAAACLNAVGYREGPFHIDVIQGPQGPVFVEMGFRLSGGGLVDLVARATGADWAELAFRAHLDNEAPAPPPAGAPAGQVVAVSEEELTAGAALGPAGAMVEVVRTVPPPPLDLIAPEDRAALASDRLRHTGAAGRVIVTGGRAEHVRAALQSVVAHRLRG